MPEKISLANLAYGAAMEQFEREFSRVLENIADPNTDAKKARKVIVTLEVKPDENRSFANITVTTKATLMPSTSIKTSMIIDRSNNGDVIGAELLSSSPGQMRFDTNGEVQEATGAEIFVPTTIK